MQVFLSMIIPFIQKYWVWLLGVIGVFLIVRKLKVGNRNTFSTDYSTVGSTITQEQAKAYAQRLYNAMADFGTDESVIKSIFNILSSNYANLRLVHNAFGVRPYGQFGEPSYFWMPSTDGDLLQWLSWEVSSSSLKKWKTLYFNAGMA